MTATVKPKHLRLQAELQTRLESDVSVVCTGVDGDLGSLWPEEKKAIRGAVVRRQREFAAGRAAAREAMAQIGWPAEAIPSSPDRSPVWPAGMVGSIAHNGHVCVAIAGRRDQAHAIGIDIEEDISLSTDLWVTICTPNELAIIATLPRSERGRWVTRLFCAKEAFYKWQYPQTERMLDFCDVQITLSRTSFNVLPAVFEDSPLLLCERKGRWLTSNGLILAWLIGRPVSQMRGE